MSKNRTDISEELIVGLSLRNIGMIIGALVLASLAYYDLKAQIIEAKKLPEPVISRTEFDLKDELVRATIMNTQSDVEDIKEQLDKLEERLFEKR